MECNGSIMLDGKHLEPVRGGEVVIRQFTIPLFDAVRRWRDGQDEEFQALIQSDQGLRHFFTVEVVSFFIARNI